MYKCKGKLTKEFYMRKFTEYANCKNTKVGDVVKLVYDWRFGGQDLTGTAIVLKITSTTMQVMTEKEKLVFYKKKGYVSDYFTGKYGDTLYR